MKIVYSTFIIVMSIFLQFMKTDSISTTGAESKITKNILVFCFPGGKSHSFVFQELLEYTIKKLAQEKPNMEYKFHIVVHNFDSNLWKDSGYNVIGYGDVKEYEEKFFKAMEMAKDDPVMGYNSFNSAMIHLNHDFMKDGIVEKLAGIKYDLMLSDVVNFPSIFMKAKFGIDKHVYMNPTCIYTWLNTQIEYNASYQPLIGTTFTETMNFFERFVNQVYLIGTRFMYTYFNYVQAAVFTEYGYNYNMDPFPKDAFYLNQCVNGVHFSMSLPPNVISTGAVLPKPAKPLTDEELNVFLSKNIKNIYISQGTITKALRLEILLNLFSKFPNIGFVMSITSIEDSLKFPNNVLIRKWVPQNDLLGDPRIHGFLTHGGLNSILEALYHAKPMIVIGTSLDQVNGAVVVNYRKYGIGVTNDNDFNIEFLQRSISLILYDPIFKENCLTASKLVKETDGKEIFSYWLNYIIENGFEHLLIPSIVEYNFIQMYNVDVALVWIFLIYLTFKLSRWLLRKAFYLSFEIFLLKDAK